MLKAKKGDWVQIENVVLAAGEKAQQVAEDKQNCELKMWGKGEALSDADALEELEVKTTTGRVVKGRLGDINARYVHDYGEFQPEMLNSERQLKSILVGGEH